MRIRRIASWFAPHGLVALLRRRAAKTSRLEAAAVRERAKAAYLRASRNSEGVTVASHDDAVLFHVARGLEERDVREASISTESISFITQALHDLPAPTTGIHVGNFVGISLAMIAASESERHADHLLVGIDPNVPHRGIANPQQHVCALIDATNVASNVLLLCGYSVQPNPSNDEWTFSAYDPEAAWVDEHAPNGVLTNLARFGTFDFAVLDGNHFGPYLQAEIAILEGLIRPDGLVFIDDCAEWFPDIQRTFEMPWREWERADWNGRVGVLRRKHPTG